MADSEKYNAYMRKYRAENRDRINTLNRERYANLEHGELEAVKEKSRIRSRRHLAMHRDDVNEKKRNKNWYYTVEKGRDKRQKHQRNNPSSVILSAVKFRSKKKGLDFDLTKEWYMAEYEKRCAVTNIPFDVVGDRSPWTPHIDRIVPEKGYLKSNCRLVCACFNLAKKNWGDDDVLIMASGLLNNYKKK
jgi:hypothetical protein